MSKKIITEQHLTDFEQYLRCEEKSNATIRKYLCDVRRWMGFLAGKEVDKEKMLKYKETLGQDYAVTSANSMIASVNAFLRFENWQELCIHQFKIQRQAYCPEEKELSKEEYVRLVGAAAKMGNERLSLMIQTICGTGIRVSELTYITAEAVKQGQVTVRCKGKTRTIFLVTKLRKKILKYMNEQRICRGPVFITKSGKPIDRSNVWREMKAICKEAGVQKEKVFPHNLRHLSARTFYNLEKDIAKLADILGHSSINTTRIYIITTGAEHRKRMERMRLII